MKRRRRVGKRGSKSWRKRAPICCICTKYRWFGNSARGRFSHRDMREMEKYAIE